MRPFGILVTLLILLIGCATQPKNDNTQTQPTETQNNNATVTFFNSSSYYVSVHRDAFSGVVIAELSSGETKTVEVMASDNYGIGTMFSIGFKTSVFNDFNLSCGPVYAYGIDPQMQISINLEAKQSYTLTITQPQNLVYETAFMKIINTSDNYFNLAKLGQVCKQTGNGVLTVQAGEIGIYEIESSKDGKLFDGYKLRTVFTDVDFPSFTAYYSHVYTFIFNGTTITKSGDDTLTY